MHITFEEIFSFQIETEKCFFHIHVTLILNTLKFYMHTLCKSTYEMVKWIPRILYVLLYPETISPVGPK